MSLLDAFLLDPAPFEVWIANRTDGLKGSGTASDPYDGSTHGITLRFDEVMTLFASQSNVTIHLGPGTFQTAGYWDTGGWQARPGMKILGSGIDVTILQLVPGTSAVHYFAIAHAPTTVVDAFEVCDLTIQCSLGDAGFDSACGGVRIMGNHARIQRVKVKDWGTNSAGLPCFALSVLTAYPDIGPAEVVNAGIEGCIVVEPNPGNAGPACALNVGSQNDLSFTNEGHAKSPYIRNCFVDCGLTGNPSPTGQFRGMSMGWCRGGVIEGNHVYNTDIGGPYQDQRSVKDMIVRNNFFKNVARGPYLNLGQVSGTSLGSGTLSQTGSVVTITLTGVMSLGLTVGDRVSIDATSTGFPGVFLVRSVVQPNQFTVSLVVTVSGSTVNSVKRVYSVGRAIVEGNLIELAPGITGVIGIHVADNSSLSPGALPPDYVHGDIIVRNNKIRYVDGAVPADTSAALVQVSGANHPIVKENVFDSVATHPVQNQHCGPATCFNNRVIQGTLIKGWNIDTNRTYDELETDVEDALLVALLDTR